MKLYVARLGVNCGVSEIACQDESEFDKSDLEMWLYEGNGVKVFASRDYDTTKKAYFKGLEKILETVGWAITTIKEKDELDKNEGVNILDEALKETGMAEPDLPPFSFSTVYIKKDDDGFFCWYDKESNLRHCKATNDEINKHKWKPYFIENDIAIPGENHPSS